jgi:hypothetical protein
MHMRHQARQIRVIQFVTMHAHKEAGSTQFVVFATAKRSSLVLDVSRRSVQTATACSTLVRVVIRAMDAVHVISKLESVDVDTLTAASLVSSKRVQMTAWTVATAIRTPDIALVAMMQAGNHSLDLLANSGLVHMTAPVVESAIVTTESASARMVIPEYSVRKQHAVRMKTWSMTT